MLIVLPLLIATVLVSGIISAFSAGNGLTRIAMQFLGFKAEELKKYVENQWDLLVTNGLSRDEAFVDVAKKSVFSYADTIVKSNTEIILAFDEHTRVVMATDEVEVTETDEPSIAALFNDRSDGWVEFRMGGRDRVGHAFYFNPFKWYFIVAEDRSVFYSEVRAITLQSGIILASSCALAIVLLGVFSLYLTRPLKRVVTAMAHVINTNDFTRRVSVEYADEIGGLAHEFNIMTAEIEKSYNRIKEFALKEALARKQVVQREYETLNVLGKAAEYKDPETGAHIIRVGYYATMLARLLNEDQLSRDLIFYAAPLHDIGKIGVPDSILLKPGRLTTLEFDTMRDHTQIGYEILRHSQSPYLHAGATIALTHHEKYNGSGYPGGLVGEKIPLYGRIVGLIDVFDALTSKRPYKEAWPLERAIELLVSERNEHFDPRIVDLFVASRSEMERIFYEHQEE